MAKELRYYQKDAIRGTLEWWDNIGPRALVSMWPGSGKTLTGVKLIRQIHETIKSNPRVIWLAHRQELITQPKRVFHEEFLMEINARKLRLGLIGGVDGKTFRDYRSHFYCASIQSLIYRGEASTHLQAILAHGPIDYLVVDETHHITAATYLKLLEVLFEANKNLKMLGITGTHNRADEVSLANVFNDRGKDTEFAYRYTFEQARADKVSAPIKPFEMKTSINLGKFKPGESGEIAQARYDELWEAGNWGDLMVEGLKQKGFPDNEICLAFMPSVKVSASFVKFLGENYGIEGAHIGDTGAMRWSNFKQEMIPIKRSEMWKLYEKGELRIVSNYNVATEGFDSPKTKLGLLCRRTNSEGTYIQMAARYTRPYPGPLVGDEYATLLHVGFQGHPFVDSSCLGGEMIPEEIKEIQEILELISIPKQKQLCPDCGNEVKTENGKIQCTGCGMEWMVPDKGKELFFDIHDTNKLSGKGVHFEALKLIRDAEVSWTQENGILSAYVGTNPYGNLVGSPKLADVITEANKRVFYGKSEKVLIVTSPGLCPQVDHDKYALICVFKPVLSSEWAGGRFNKYQVHKFASQDYVIVGSYSTLDEAVSIANTIAELYKDPVLASKDKSWRAEPITDKQKNALRQFGFDMSKMTKGQASDIQNFKYAQFFASRHGALRKPQ